MRSCRSSKPSVLRVGAPNSSPAFVQLPGPAVDVAVVGLLELVAVHRIVEEVREVGEQIELVLEPVGRRLELAAGERRRIVERQAVALRLAAVAVVERAVAADEAVVDRALGDLVGRVPLAAVGHRGDAELAVADRHHVAQHRVALPEVVGHLPRTVVVQVFETVGEHAGARAAPSRRAARARSRSRRTVPSAMPSFMLSE